MAFVKVIVQSKRFIRLSVQNKENSIAHTVFHPLHLKAMHVGNLIMSGCDKHRGISRTGLTWKCTFLYFSISLQLPDLAGYEINLLHTFWRLHMIPIDVHWDLKRRFTLMLKAWPKWLTTESDKGYCSWVVRPISTAIQCAWGKKGTAYSRSVFKTKCNQLSGSGLSPESKTNAFSLVFILVMRGEVTEEFSFIFYVTYML